MNEDMQIEVKELVQDYIKNNLKLEIERYANTMTVSLVLNGEVVSSDVFEV